jgi:hypothetical protein
VTLAKLYMHRPLAKIPVGSRGLAIFGDIGSVFVMGVAGVGFSSIILVLPRLLAPTIPNSS